MQEEAKPKKVGKRLETLEEFLASMKKAHPRVVETIEEFVKAPIKTNDRKKRY